MTTAHDDDHDDNQRDEETGRFLPGNRFWQARTSQGRPATFEDPDALWAACCEYFAWVDDNPLHEARAFAYQGAVTQDNLPKMRAMSIAALCLFLDIDRETWRLWRTSRPDLFGVIRKAEAVIFAQKFEGAAADLLNANIIARDLGLADRQEVTGKDGGPVEMKGLATVEVARRVAFLLASGMEALDHDNSQTRAIHSLKG